MEEKAAKYAHLPVYNREEEQRKAREREARLAQLFSDVDQQLGDITDLTSFHMETRSKVASSSRTINTAPTPFDEPSPPCPVDIHTIRYSRGVLNPRPSESRTQDLRNGGDPASKSPAARQSSTNQSVVSLAASGKGAVTSTAKQASSTSSTASELITNQNQSTPTLSPDHNVQAAPSSHQLQPAPPSHVVPTPESRAARPAAQEARAAVGAATDDDSELTDYEEQQSYCSTATLRLTQRLEPQPAAATVLPPYKRSGPLPDGGAGPAAAADDELTYERLGRQFQDLTAKMESVVRDISDREIPFIDSEEIGPDPRSVPRH